ncbi:Plastocyanin [Paenibacillus sp. 1_12]|uniref:plastocyanin/azurin family copper-binding protein n=1 Tax=Paenibacillus sp. 1_12 TaxID=1566278 RepID=UPI0008E32B66|nr:plastocyanin/azurin family copper-binding protein [Paenibacillus sp. 1_12]SFL98184.1 Plastocyanin [Paenibacillus sp. 1_12]
MNKRLGALLLSLILMLALGGTVFAANPASSEQWNVFVGKEQGQVSLDSMFPKVIYIHEGDKVKFTNGAKATPHTVTFLAGAAPLNSEDPVNLAPSTASGSKWDGKSLINSGMLTPTQDYSITFTTSGAFPYYCIVHPLMTGTVVVLPVGASIPSLIQQTAGAKSDEEDLMAQANALNHVNMDAHYMKNTDGSMMYMVDAGMGSRGFSTNAMMPESIYINEGDSIQWLNDNQYEPHFVTFNKPDDLNFFTPQGSFNDKFMVPSGGAKFDGTGFFNSGIMLAQKSYSLTFTQAGTYVYECYLHSGSKMVGTVVVAPKGDVKLEVNGKPITAASAKLYKNHVYAAIIPLVEAIGGTVEWNNELGAVVINFGGTHDLPAKLQPAPGVKLVINGQQFMSVLEPQMIDGHGYVALEDIVSLLGGSYSWNAATQLFAATVK